MKHLSLIFGLLLILQSCTERQDVKRTESNTSNYLDYSNRDDILSGGVKMIPIQTESGEFKVWTKRTGNNPKMKVLLLHGGPGAMVHSRRYDQPTGRALHARIRPHAEPWSRRRR